MWEGAKLPGDIQCNCKKGISQHTMEFKNHPIVQHGREYAAGSSTYFETNFNRAFEIQRPDTTRVSTHLLLSLRDPHPFPRHINAL